MAILRLALTAFSVAPLGSSPPTRTFTNRLHVSLPQRRQTSTRAKFRCDLPLFTASPFTGDLIPIDDTTAIEPVDKRPHEQRVEAPRTARRLNHAFQHLYRHSDPRWDDNDWNDLDWANDAEFCMNADRLFAASNATAAAQPTNQRAALSAVHYLTTYGGYSLEDIQHMHAAFPPLFEMDVKRHLRPKMRFLKDCMKGEIHLPSDNNGDICSRRVLHPRLRAVLPACFFGARFERTIAPRHAFLVHAGLPYGRDLWNTVGGQTTSFFEEFLFMHRKPKQFAAMCNAWRSKYTSTNIDGCLPFTSEQIVAFDKLFQRGMLSAARNDTAYVFPDELDGTRSNGKSIDAASLMTTANVTSAQIIRYLIQHGANPYEEDVRGASLFHWAAGSGNLQALNELVTCCNQLGLDKMSTNDTKHAGSGHLINPGFHAALLWKASRDDATPFHWAAAGSGPKEFGIGGHVSICNYLLALCKVDACAFISEKTLINAKTKDGNTILMWAAWSQSLDVVKFLVRNRADSSTCNRNGCSVAHWAASGGNLSVCKYLAEIAKVDFSVENFAGNTPLSHAVAYQRVEVVKWLREELRVEDKGGVAADLAMDFVNWADSGLGLIGEEQEIDRRKVYDLFKDWTLEMGEENS